MSTAEMADLEAEIQGEAATGTEAPGAAPGAGDPAPKKPNDPALGKALAAVFKMGGNVVCSRLRVDGLTTEEATALGDAVANLLNAYDLSIDDPRIVAWIGLVGATAMIAMPRMEQFDAMRRAHAAPVIEQPELEPMTAPAPAGAYDKVTADTRAMANEKTIGGPGPSGPEPRQAGERKNDARVKPAKGAPARPAARSQRRSGAR